MEMGKTLGYISFCTDALIQGMNATNNSLVKRFDRDGVSLFFEWPDLNESFTDVHLSATVLPPARIVVRNGSNAVHINIRVSYNTLYNISVFITSLCGSVKLVTSFNHLYFSKQYHSMSTIYEAS